MNFARKLIRWQQEHGRHNLPWQGTRDPYRIWVSEIMLQQTQVVAVIPYYQRFITRFPDVAALALASEEEVLARWAGLGYYARGRNLHRAAQQIMQAHGGIFPKTHEDILALPGIGRSTAAAISAFAFGERRAILDGNVKRVLTRVHGIAAWPGERKIEQNLWQLAESLMPAKDIDIYTQALMDLGATICTRSRPDCGRCPVADRCVARAQNLTATIPARRPKKPLPQHQTTLIVLRHGRDVLLEKRPPAGIWGGLWCLPETSLPPEQSCLALTGQAPEAVRELTSFTHTFTHFRLDIRSVELRLPRLSQPAAEPGKIWMDLASALESAIPKPVKTLLQSLGQS